MTSGPLDPALTVAIALAAGMLAQSAARHLGLPDIVLPLAAWRDDRLVFVDEQYEPRPEDRLQALVQCEREEAARDAMRRHGWRPGTVEPAPEMKTAEGRR